MSERFSKKRNRYRGEKYLQAYPRHEKWIVECLCCHKKGYDPQMPEQISVVEGNTGAEQIRKYYSPMLLDENGYCEQCSKVLVKK